MRLLLFSLQAYPCHESSIARIAKLIQWISHVGLSYFWYRWHLIIIHRVLDNPYLNNDAPDETLVLMTIGRSPNLLRALLAEARTHYLQSESRKTTVYTINTSNFQKCWDNGRSRASRDISTVIMEDKDKDLILRDTKDYLNPVTARWYAARGLPYRRGYLFYGPPGTGKTSLTLALAGELKLNLYIFNLGAGGGVTDETLGQLFQALPKKCIVLLEDIDCAGIGRGSNSNLQGFMYPYENSFEGPTEEPEEEVNTQSVERQSDQQHGVGASEKFESAGRRAIGPESRSSGDTTASKDKDKLTLNTTHSRMSINSMQYPTNHKPASQISFSGLLNAIDGVASHEGRILIMTTNYRERLDPALIRPGRVDVEIEFGFASKETIRRVFTELYKGLNNLPEQPLPQHMSPRKDPYDGEDAIYHPSPDGSIISGYEFSCGDGFKDAGDIELLAQKFANAVPSGVFTPAELQGFLMMHKQNPGMAVKEVGGWVNKKYATRGSQGTTRVNRTSTTVPEAPISETRRNSWELLPRDTVSTNLSSDKIPASTGQTLQDVSRGDKNVPSAPATLKSEARQSSCNTGQSEQ